MYLVDEENHIIHDMSFTKYECQIKKIPEDKKRKIHTLDQVKRMVDTNHRPQYNGCQWCMPEYHIFDITKIFS
ncbi:MAG: hypothetical protein PHI18_08325 [bacterium]|nr:hypothetical protein [bacterium]